MDGLKVAVLGRYCMAPREMEVKLEDMEAEKNPQDQRGAYISGEAEREEKRIDLRF